MFDKKKDSAPKKISEIMTIIDQDGNTFITEDREIMDFYQIVCKDISSVSGDELDRDEACFAALYRTLHTDFKIIGINFPTDTGRQIRYFTEKMNNTSDSIFREILQKRLDEMEYLHQHITAREYYLMFFSDSKEQHRENQSIILSTLSQGSSPLIQQISMEKKVEVLYRMHNPNVMMD